MKGIQVYVFYFKQRLLTILQKFCHGSAPFGIAGPSISFCGRLVTILVICEVGVIISLISVKGDKKFNCFIYETQVDSYAYLPPNFHHSIRCDASATLVVFERRFVSPSDCFDGLSSHCFKSHVIIVVSSTSGVTCMILHDIKLQYEWSEKLDLSETVFLIMKHF